MTMTQVMNPAKVTLSQAPQALAGHFAVYELKLLSHRISAGFPSPAADYAEDGLDLNHYLVQNKPATFMFTVKGDSMLSAGICDGDKVVVDKALKPKHKTLLWLSSMVNTPSSASINCVVVLSSNQKIPITSLLPLTRVVSCRSGVWLLE